MNCNIRKATANDADNLFALVCDFATSFQPQRQLFERCLYEFLTDESVWLSVAEDRGEVVGYCLGFDHYTFYANGRVAWLEEIMVTAELRQRGIGSLLMEAFEAWATLRGSKLIALATRRAAPFYTSLGYEASATYFRKVL
jgi:GNAT superfamily N-acetyltransferase